MLSSRNKPAIDKVVYNFKKRPGGQIDIVPIASRLLTPVNINRTTAPHRTDFHRIIQFESGEPIHVVDFQNIPVRSPALLFVHKDRIHRFDMKTPHDGKVLIFTDDFFSRSPADSRFLKNTPLFKHDGGAYLINNPEAPLDNLFNLIEREIHLRDEERKTDILHSLLSAFLYLAERVHAGECRKFPNAILQWTLTDQFMVLLEHNYTNRLPMSKYCELLNVSPAKLNEALTASTGKTGKELVIERVVLEAKRLLAYSDLNVKQIGFELGFEQPTNFIKFFHVNTGHTPLDFQRANS